MILVFLSSGLFLGWSLGANDAANVFGAAVGSRMVRFRTAAILCAIFVVLGAAIGGAGTTRTLGQLGAIDALPGAFVVALAAAAAVYGMIRMRITVSTSQAIVGAIVSWNLFAGKPTDLGSLSRIVSTWILCPLAAAVLAIIIYYAYKGLLSLTRPHLLVHDAQTRTGLIAIGAFASYALGANNIGNVIGVFLPARPFQDLDLLGLLVIPGDRLLLFVGGLAIAAGVLTYSRHTMRTVGRDIMKLSPEIALVVVLAHSLVLFLFSSQEIEAGLHALGLPGIPLVPVSSSQAIVGAIIGIALVKGGRGVRYDVLLRIIAGWLLNPVIAGLFSWVGLSVMENVFAIPVRLK